MASQCPISRKRFLDNAKPLTILIGDDAKVMALPKEFPTSKSFGWWFNHKFFLQLDGVTLPIQPSIGLIVIGSKSIP